MSTTSASNASGQFGDTTYTKVFVGGLAWETQNETLRTYFEQFGDIVEAVVIMDKYSGRSKGYGFVTFKEAEGARKACVDPAPVIDGRTANCNLASLGVQRSRPSTPQHGGGKSFRIKNSFQTGFQGGFPSAPTFPHYAIPHRPSTYNLYGYSPTSANYAYPMSYYNVYGGIGTTSQYPIHGTGSSGTNIPTTSTANANFYPYLNLGQSFAFHYPQYYFQYSTMDSSAPPQHYASSMSLIPTSPYPLNKV